MATVMIFTIRHLGENNSFKPKVGGFHLAAEDVEQSVVHAYGNKDARNDY